MCRSNSYARLPDGTSRLKCPNCDGICDAEHVDIGVGEQRVEPWHCRQCGWTEPVEANPLISDEEFPF